jgi:hypothetical protein
MQTTSWRLRVDRSEISYLRFILESYDGLATLSTLEAAAGKVELRIAPGCEPQVRRIIRDLQKDILIEEMVAT